MPITCFIRYEIDPNEHAQFEEYARNRGRCIPDCGADLVGYFAPHEGSATTAYGVYHVDSLAHYEGYRARLREHPIGRENHRFARAERFLAKEDRPFLPLTSTPHARGVR